MDPLRPKARNVPGIEPRTALFRRRLGGLMLCGGGLLGLLTLVAPRAGDGNELPLVATAGAALLCGAAIAARPASFGDFSEPFFVALATALITFSMLAGGVAEPGAGTADNQVFYLLVIVYAFYFMSLRQALVQLAIVAAAYGTLLLGDLEPAVAGTRWATTIGSLTAGGLLVRALNRRVDGLIAQLGASARRDPLTGALNRRGLDERLGVELLRARRSGEPLALLAADLDGLKVVNDRLGHRAGDDALRLAADVMTRRLRGSDVLARVGGDEFVAILPGAPAPHAAAVADAIRTEMSRLAEVEAWPITLSFGVAAAPPLPLDPDALSAAADRALYRAKAAGRDRTALAGSAELRAVSELPAVAELD